MSRLRRFRRLPLYERGLVVRALLLLPLARLSLTVCGFRRTYRLFQRAFGIASRPLDGRPAEQAAETTMRMIRAAAVNGMCRTTCLPRSLVLWALLRHQGLDPELRLGARKKAGAFEAHAWVEWGSMVLDAETADAGRPFVPFAIESRLNDVS